MDQEDETLHADDVLIKRTKAANRVAWLLSVAGLALVTCIFIFQHAWPLIGLLGLLYLPAMILVYWSYGGLIRFTPVGGQAQPLSMLASVTFLQAFWQFIACHVVALGPIIPYVLGGGLLVTAFFYLGPRRVWGRESGGALLAVAVFIVACAYSFSAALYIDHLAAAKAPSHVYPTQLVRKYTIEGKGVVYRVRVAHWDWTVNNDLEVDQDLFNSLAIGDSVRVREYNGKLGGHWYELSK